MRSSLVALATLFAVHALSSCGGRSVTRVGGGDGTAPSGRGGGVTGGAGGVGGAAGRGGTGCGATGCGATGGVPMGSGAMGGAFGGRPAASGGSGGRVGAAAGRGGAGGSSGGGTGGVATGGMAGEDLSSAATGPSPDNGGAGELAGAGGDTSVPDECIRPGFSLYVPTEFAHVQEAIDAAEDGDVIVVAPGTYSESLDFRGKRITLISGAGPAQTILDGGYVGPVITMSSGETAATVVEGFTLTRGNAYEGSGIALIDSSPTIRGNWFIGNNSGFGYWATAIGGRNASPVIDSNYFHDNFGNNDTTAAVMAFAERSSPTIVNNILLWNQCSGIAFEPTGEITPFVANNTLVGQRLGVHLRSPAFTDGAVFQNNVIFRNDVGLQVDEDSSASGPFWVHNLVFDNLVAFDGMNEPTGTNGNLAVDPLFVALGDRNLRLSPGSPAIDAGTPALLLPSLDYDGRQRTSDGDGNGTATPDMGAYEYRAPLICAPVLRPL